MRSIKALIRSVWFNIKFLSFRQAIYLPIWIDSCVDIQKLKKGQIVLNKIRPKIVLLGGGKTAGMNAGRTTILLDSKSKLFFQGKAVISEGTTLRCNQDSIMEIGDNFYCNCNCFISSTNKVQIGNDCIFGWRITINTGDGHKVLHQGINSEGRQDIIIGKHVWLAPDCSLTKGVVIPDNCIVAQKAVVTKAFSKPNCMIGGIPAKIIREDINWE